MFYLIPFLAGHPSTKLQDEVKEFFRLLSGYHFDKHSVYVNDTTYFSSTFSKTLQVSKTLNGLLEAFFNVYKCLTVSEKKQVTDQFTNCEIIDDILDDISINAHALKLSALPSTVHTVVHNLFYYLFETTLKSSLTRHYSDLYDIISQHTKYCAFCGIEPLPKPNTRKADYDHLMYKGDYPLMAVNMRNLTPMGNDCNRDHKKIQDVLHNKNGQRRQFLNPFKLKYNLTISLQGSTLPNVQYKNGNWCITFSNNDVIVEAWKEVFNIEQRYIEELEGHFTTWLNIFKDEYKGHINDVNILKAAFRRRATSHKPYFYTDSNIIKHGLFDYLSICNDQIFYASVLKDIMS